MLSAFATIRQNPDDYPLTNIRWSHAVLWFVALPALAGATENDLMLAIGGAGLGLGFCLFMSFGMYGMDRYRDSLIARITLALIVTGLVTALLVLVGVLLAAAVTVLTPLIAVGVLACGIFIAVLYYLS